MTNPKKYDVLGIGNAIVDVLSFCEPDFLADQNLALGSMTLIDGERAAQLYAQIGPSTECSGGSAANTLAGLASLGARTAFIGKVSEDQLGTIFTHDLQSVGVHFTTAPIAGSLPTASCMVFVTPDAQRTMATFLGSCSKVSAADIDEDLIAQSHIVYIEGYLWDEENAKAAIRKAIRIAKKQGAKVALTLSDTFCVDRHRAEFLELIKADIDILFANENEAKSLLQKEDFNDVLAGMRGICPLVAITRSAEGSVVLTKESAVQVPARPIDQVIDTTGAGDLYAAGFLYGIIKGHDLKSSAKLGNLCAGHIITQLGARSMLPLNQFLNVA